MNAHILKCPLSLNNFLFLTLWWFPSFQQSAEVTYMMEGNHLYFTKQKKKAWAKVPSTKLTSKLHILLRDPRPSLHLAYHTEQVWKLSGIIWSAPLSTANQLSQISPFLTLTLHLTHVKLTDLKLKETGSNLKLDWYQA